MIFLEVVPIFRIFSVEKALDFYVGYLGFHEDWRADTDGGPPLFLQVSRGGIRLRLSEHHADCSPNSAIFIQMQDVIALHAELTAKPYAYMRPGLDDGALGARQVTVTDPFGNRIHFRENSQA